MEPTVSSGKKIIFPKAPSDRAQSMPWFRAKIRAAAAAAWVSRLFEPTLVEVEV